MFSVHTPTVSSNVCIVMAFHLSVGVWIGTSAVIYVDISSVLFGCIASERIARVSIKILDITPSLTQLSRPTDLFLGTQNGGTYGI